MEHHQGPPRERDRRGRGHWEPKRQTYKDREEQRSMERDSARSDLSGTGPDVQHRGTRRELERKTQLLERQTKDQKGEMGEGHAQD